MRLARLAATLVAACLVSTACAVSAAAPPSPVPTERAPFTDPTAAPAGDPTAPPTAPPATPSASAATPSPTATPTPTPSASAVTTPTVAPTPPTAQAFWARAAHGLADAGRLRIRVIGPSPGELRYVETASATAIGGLVVFVCRGGSAYDGQSGWMEVPGDWSCGSEALIQGFRLTGQPLDAWSAALPPDEGIEERIALAGDGTWRWEYRGRNPFAGGDVRTTVVLDPRTGQIRTAERTDPTGATTYGLSYTESFPPIAVP